MYKIKQKTKNNPAKSIDLMRQRNSFLTKLIKYSISSKVRKSLAKILNK